MNKTDLVRHVVSEAGMTRANAGDAVDAMLSGIAGSLGRGEAVSLPGFGTFAIRDRPARTGRNPRTGESIGIAASTIAGLVGGTTARGAVSGGACGWAA